MGLGDMYQAQIDAEDANRFRWWFGPEDKVIVALPYFDGCTKGWTLDQWRAAVDAAMAGVPITHTSASEAK
jgi:hypothetical protein